jgi:hypothetical protein
MTRCEVPDCKKGVRSHGYPCSNCGGTGLIYSPPRRVTSKAMMFPMLDAGAFGNTVSRWYSLREWENRTQFGSLWAIRNATGAGNDKRQRLDIPTADLPDLYRLWYGESGAEISPMVDHMLTARFQLIEDHSGLRLWWVKGRGEVKWRDAFKTLSRHDDGIVAWEVLRHYLNPNSYDDLKHVLNRFRGHAVEMTVLDRCFGTIPHRNAVVWEVRLY